MNTEKNPKISGKAAAAALAAVVLVLAGCGNASGGGSVPTSVNGFARGVITAKGSIFVNGIEYETSSSTVTVDNASGTDDNLAIGMIVDVKGTINPDTGMGVAEEVAYSTSMEGTVDTGSIDAGAGTFAVFGQTIQTSLSTVFEGATGLADTANFTVGARVEVSGMKSGSAIHASRVEVNTDSGDFKAHGTVSSLSLPTFNLTLEGGTVFAVTITSGTLDPAIVDGSVVKVEFSSAPSGGAVSTTAGNVELKHRLNAEDGDRVEAEGIVSAFSAGPPATFSVNGIAVSAAAGLAAGVADNVEVEVKGTMVSGVLVASEIELEHEADTEAEGVVVSVNLAAGSFVMHDGVDITIHVTASTIFKDDSDAPVLLFGLDDFAVSDLLEVKYYTDSGTNEHIAVKIERHEP